MKRILGKNFKVTFMIKLIITYSVIIIFTLLILVFFVKTNLADLIQKHERLFDKQIIERVGDYFDSSLTSAKEILQKIYVSDNDTRVKIFSFLENSGETVSFDNSSEKENFDRLFSSQLIKNDNIMDIIIYKSASKEVVSYTRYLRGINNEYDYFKYPWFKETFEKGGILNIIPAYKPNYIYNDNRYIYSAVASIFDTRSFKTTGEIIINMDVKKIEDSYSNYLKDLKGFILVMDSVGNVVYDSSNRYYGDKYPYFEKLNSKQDYVMLDEESMVNLDLSNRDGFVVAGIVPRKQVLESINSIVNTLYMMLIVCIIISLILVFSASSFFTRSIRKITTAMKQVEKGNLEIRISKSRGNDEIQEISLSFNKMCERLSSYIDKEYLAEIRYKEAEFNALYNQINPHFLYNTLESIRMEALINEDNDVSEMIYSLAYMFRTNLKNKERIIKIKDEIDYIKFYTDLHKIRYKDRLVIKIDISDNILEYCIPKLTLQPLIENSILYGGLNSSIDNLRITISGTINNGGIQLLIIDDGIGLDEEEVQKLKLKLAQGNNSNDGCSIGLKNTNDRIKIMYGENYGVFIESIKGSYTKVTIEIPARTIEEMNKND